MESTSFEDSADYVQSLARGLQVLRAFDRELASPSLSQVAERTGLSRAVARRLLLTLQHLGYVGSQGRNFYLTPRVLELGYSYLTSLDLTELAQQSLALLAERVGESCSMSVLDGQDIVYVLRVPVRRVMSIALGVGARLPAYATSMGRAILAGMPEAELAQWLRGQKLRALTPYTVRTVTALKAEIKRAREQGYALVSRELEVGLLALAVPIRTADGSIVAALNVGMPYSEDAATRAIKVILPAMRDAQRSIEHAIQHGGWQPHMAMMSVYG